MIPLTAVSVAFHEVRLLEAGQGDGKGFAVHWGANGGIDVQLIDDVVRTVPPTCHHTAIQYSALIHSLAGPT